MYFSEKMDPTNTNLPSLPSDLEEKSPNADTHKKPSVKSYATRVFQESTVGIVSSIFTTHSKYRRFFKVFLSSFCIAGFIYHCVAFLNHVLGYPEVVNIFSDRSKYYDSPAYTYCSNNVVRRSIFCSTYPEHCVNASEAFCQKYSSYCGANATLVPTEKYYNELPRGFSYNWILKSESIRNPLRFGASTIRRPSGDSLKNYLKQLSNRKKTQDEVTGPYLRESGTYWMVKTCYSMLSRVESKEEPLQKKRYFSDSKLYDASLHFYVNQSEMMNPRIDPGIYFLVHSPFENANPLTKGIFLKGGRTYRLYVETQREVLLKAPFASNCLDYDELWRKNNRTGTRSKKACLEKCWFDYDKSSYWCVPYNREHPHEERICETGEERKNNSFPIFKCLEGCRDECRLLKYTTQVSVQEYVKFVSLKEQRSYIDVEIYLSNEEVKVLRHSPKYETVDVISSIGGFMGCWLGIALLDILDVFGSITTACGYAFRKKLPKKLRRRHSTNPREGKLVCV